MIWYLPTFSGTQRNSRCSTGSVEFEDLDVFGRRSKTDQIIGESGIAQYCIKTFPLFSEKWAYFFLLYSISS